MKPNLAKKMKKSSITSNVSTKNSLVCRRARLFLFFEEDKYGDEVRKNIWKERGTGEVRILKHKEEKKERIVMRQEKTFKLILNHIINPMTVLVCFVV